MLCVPSPARAEHHRGVVAVVGALVVLLAACSSGSGSEPKVTAVRVRTATSSPGTTRPPASSTEPPAAAASGQATGAAITIAFGGDVHFMGSIGARLAADPSNAIGPIAGLLKKADLAMVNLETAITTRGSPQPKQFVFRAPPTAFQALRAAGVDIVTMANNHGEDYGLVGLQDSLAAASAAHLPVAGIGKDADAAYAPRRFTINGQRIAIVAATQVLDDNLISAWTAGPGKPGLASAKEEPPLVAAVRAARAGADTVVVFLHWGQELSSCPTERQRSLAPKLVAAGADIVVGSHAHVLLGGGYLGPAFVDYGLGNFVFYAGGGGPTAESGVLTLTVRGRAVTGVNWSPAQISGGVPYPLSGSAAARATVSWTVLRTCTGLKARP